MKIAVFSDSHGHAEPMINAVYAVKPDMILFLGDGLRDLREVSDTFPKIPIRAVKGNCDFGAAELEKDEFICEGKRIIMTHGHMYNVKLGYSAIVNMACCSGADILLFGHTHRKFYSVVEGLHVINPGSVGSGMNPFGVIEIKNGKISYTELESDMMN